MVELSHQLSKQYFQVCVLGIKVSDFETGSLFFFVLQMIKKCVLMHEITKATKGYCKESNKEF